MPKSNDLSRSLAAFDQDSTLIAVIEMSVLSWLVAGIAGIERQPLKKPKPDEAILLGLLHRAVQFSLRERCALVIRVSAAIAV